MFVVDTNILVYAADPDSPVQDKCFDLMEGWTRQKGAWFVTWGICYEFMRIVTHRRIFRSPWSAAQAWYFLEELLLSPGLTILIPTDRHASVLAQTIQEMPEISGNRMHDLHIAVLMREHGIRRIYTRDTDFHRFTFLEPIDPLATPPS
jgi:toxin-antitoxin system PIN domain toxin